MKTLLLLALAFSFVACNKEASTDQPAAPAVETAAPAAAPEAAPAAPAPAEAAPAAQGEAN